MTGSQLDLMLIGFEAIADDPAYMGSKVTLVWRAWRANWDAAWVAGLEICVNAIEPPSSFVGFGKTPARAVDDLFRRVEPGLAVRELVRGLRGIH